MRRIYFPSQVGQKKLGLNNTCYFLHNLYGKKGKTVSVGPSLSQNLTNLFNENMKNKRPTINIGGDHSMAIATVGASLEKYGSSLKVVWFDAHADINTRNSSPSGNFHGMPLSFLTGLDNDYDSFPFLYSVPELKFENILYLGIRDLDKYEKIILKEKNIKYIKSREINKSPEMSYDKIKAFVGENPVHFSFDVDGIDPTEMSSTGTTAKNGIHTECAKIILDKMMNELNIVNMDITEFNLEIGNPEKSMKNFTNLFEKYLKNSNK